MSLLEKDKRKFSVIIGSKKCGACSGASPSGAARKVKGKSGAFYLKETTKGSKKKLYGPYSSKKRVVQRGGKGNEEICKNVLKILKGCDNTHQFDAELYRINTQYRILELAYLLLGINSRQDKCDVLKDIIEVRDKYFIVNKKAEQKHFPLCHCLCNLKEEDNTAVEFGFINSNFKFIISRIQNLTINNKDNFHQNKWLKFIQFLRNTIRQIEVDKLEEKKRKNNEELRKLNEEVKKAKANFEARNLGGPAEEENSNNERIKSLRQMMENRKKSGPAQQNLATGPNWRPPQSMMTTIRPSKNFKPIQPPHNSQNPQSSSTNNLIAKLAALRND